MSDNLSRIGIFVFFDPQGVVDEYVIRLLDALRPNLKHLMVISNCQVAVSEKEKLASHCDQLFFRENRGMDAAAFKAGMVKFCGWEELKKYDEVVLVNDTFFGPIHSFDQMFEEMAQKNLDFWGISAGYRQEDGWGLSRYGYVPDHIQTFFVAFRQNMVASRAFQDYWNQYDDQMSAFKEVVANHEMIMTKYFQDAGFKWDIYAKTQKYCSDFQQENFNIYFYRSWEMMQNMKFPIFKKKVLSADMADLLYMNDLEDAANAMDYIKNQSDYDENLIWDNVLRLYNIEDLYHSLHLNYVFSSDPAVCSEQAAIVFHLTNPVFLNAFMERAGELSEFYSVYLIPDGHVTEEQCRSMLKEDSTVHILSGSGQDTEMGAFVLCCREFCSQYKYLGFLHDTQNPDHFPATVGESLVYGYLKNAAADRDYIAHILNCFQANPRLGILGTPFPIHHCGFENFEDRWKGYYTDVKKAADQWELQVPLSEEKQPFLINGVFWCRTAALSPIWKQSFCAGDFKRSPVSMESRENEILKRILSYSAQCAGFYSGVVMHTDYASMRITGQEIMLQSIVNMTEKQLGITSQTFAGYRDQFNIYGTAPADGKITVNLSDLGIKFLIKHIITQYFPRKFMNFIRKISCFTKRNRT